MLSFYHIYFLTRQITCVAHSRNHFAMETQQCTLCSCHCQLYTPAVAQQCFMANSYHRQQCRLYVPESERRIPTDVTYEGHIETKECSFAPGII